MGDWREHTGIFQIICNTNASIWGRLKLQQVPKLPNCKFRQDLFSNLPKLLTNLRGSQV